MTIILMTTKNIRPAGITGPHWQRLSNYARRTSLRSRKRVEMLSSRRSGIILTLSLHGSRVGFFVENIQASSKRISGRELTTCRLHGFSNPTSSRRYCRAPNLSTSRPGRRVEAPVSERPWRYFCELLIDENLVFRWEPLASEVPAAIVAPVS
jgi:hypothetical protein